MAKSWDSHERRILYFILYDDEFLNFLLILYFDHDGLSAWRRQECVGAISVSTARLYRILSMWNLRDVFYIHILLFDQVRHEALSPIFRELIAHSFKLTTDYLRANSHL